MTICKCVQTRPEVKSYVNSEVYRPIADRQATLPGLMHVFLLRCVNSAFHWYAAIQLAFREGRPIAE